MKIFIRIYLLIILTLIVENNQPKYRCGTNILKKITPKEMPPKFIISKEDPLYNRRLKYVDNDGFLNISIYVDKYNIQKKLSTSNIRQYQSIIINALDKAAKTLQKLLKVKPIVNGYQFTDDELRELELVSWDTNKFGTRAYNQGVNMNNLGIDLIIFSTIEDMDEDVIAAATPVYTQSSNHQPILGIVYINNYIDFSKKNIKKYLETTLIHEMTHILGFMGSFFENYFHNIITKKDKYGITRQYINSAKVLNVARKYFNCSSIEGVELENYGDEGTAGSHWEARILLGDYMNGVAYTEEVISEFTLALLEDTGIYKPYYYTGGLMRYGKHKGCEFVYDKCVNSNEKINSNFENEFFDNIYSSHSIDASCSSGRISRTYNILWNYNRPIEKQYRYFGDPYIGGWGAADYCPLPGTHYDEEKDTYYGGICSGSEMGVYGSKIFYNSEKDYYLNKDLIPITGEEISEKSFCFLSSLFKNDISDINKYSKVIRANCYKIYCSKKSLSVKINNDYIVCPRSGGKIKVDGYEGYLLCPDYNLMCSGRVICNDLFDCVDKNSLVKESSYIYDYTIKTSQDIEKAEAAEADNENNYELSTNGICPQYCKHCYENNICIKCKENYNFLGNKETNEIICINKDDISKGYFLGENNIYYKCMEHCDSCNNLESCEKCEEGFDYNYNKCINIHINNCLEEDELGICTKCNNNYAFNGTDRNFCIEKNKFNNNNYYTKDNGISYFLCWIGISGCSNCEYNSNSGYLLCYKSISGYILSIDENKCLEKDYVDENTDRYHYIDNNSAEIIKNSERNINTQKSSNNSGYIKSFNFSFIYLVIFILSFM